VPEFGLLSVVVLSSGIGMAIYLLRKKNVPRNEFGNNLDI